MTNSAKRKGDSLLLAAFASGMTVRDAAKAASVSESTAHRRMRDPTFKRQVAELRAGLIERAAGQLSEAATDAVTTLRALLSASAETVRLGAARAILELGTKLRESVELEQRIAALEEAMTGGR